jgi:acyl-CoA thioesterase YciA
MDLITTHPIKKSDLGFHGNLFGGKLLAWLDAAAVAYAMQLCDTPRMVTVSIDKCVFEKPSKEGQLLKIFGRPAAIGNTSITLYMEARSHNVRTGKQNIVLKTHTKFVYIDEDGSPIPLKDRSVRLITEMIEKNKEDEKSV